jgi:hypothetical protein
VRPGTPPSTSSLTPPAAKGQQQGLWVRLPLAGRRGECCHTSALQLPHKPAALGGSSQSGSVLSVCATALLLAVQLLCSKQHVTAGAGASPALFPAPVLQALRSAAAAAGHTPHAAELCSGAVLPGPR